MRNRVKYVAIPAIAVALLASFFLVTTQPAIAQLPWSVFDRIMVEEIRILGGGQTIDSGGLTVTAGGLTVTAGGATVTGAADFNTSLNSDGATTLNSTLDVDGNVSSGTGSFTVTDSVNVTGAVDFDSTLNVDGNATLNGTLDVDGNVSSGTGAFTVTDNVLIDGQADAVQLTVQGYTTQTSNVFVVENSVGTDLMQVTNAAGVNVVSGGFDVQAGGLAMAGLMTIDAATSITVTDGNPFTPTGTYQPIAAAGTVTPTVTVLSAGRVVILTNTSAQTINIADSGTTKLSAAGALGQFDSLTLLSDGTNWIELSRSDN